MTTKKSKRVLVTGGAGFIGSNLVNRLISDGHEVIVLDDLSSGYMDNLHPDAKFYEVDISRPEQHPGFDWFFEDVDVVFHIAARARVQPSIEDPVSFNRVNVAGTLNILHSAHKAGVRRVVYSSSSSCYGNAQHFPTPETHSINPLSPYGLQKYIGEEYCRLFSEVYDLETVSLRYFNVYGMGMPMEGAYKLVLSTFATQMLENKPLTITNSGEQRRDFTHVEDVVEANMLAAFSETPMTGTTYNIGNGNNFSVNELADMFGGEKEYGHERLEPFETLADNRKAREELGWVPTGDLPEFVEKFKEHLNG